MEKCINWIKDKNIIYLIVGFIFSVFSIGRFNIVISIYIWPFCFLTYLHKRTSKIFPIVAIVICLMFSNMLRWIGSSNLNIGADFLMGLYFSFINIIPFLVDAFFYKSDLRLQSVFIFPLLVSICEFLFGFSVLANINMFAYAHRENIQFLQIISLFGSYFLSFIIALFSSILDYSLQLFKEQKKISKIIFIYAFIIIIIYCFGFIRLLIPQEKEYYNIASSIGVSQKLYEEGKESVLPITDYINYINDKLEKANKSNAQIMIFAEEAFAIKKQDREEMIRNVRELAIEYHIFILLPIDVEEDRTSNKNEAILISDEGELLYQYQKQHLVPIIEKDYYEDMEKVEVIETKLGKLTTVICYDINYPYFINSLSRKHFDILLVPSWDWPGIAEYHSNEIRYRAIEGGFNLVKNTANGIVISSDTRGRTLSYYIGKDCEDYFVISTVNKKGVKTLYSYIGFLFNYLYILCLICILIIDIIMEKLSLKRRISTIVSPKSLIDSNIED